MLDERLDEILVLGKYIHPNKEGVLIDVAGMKQAIKEAMCDARGCEPSSVARKGDRYVVPTPVRGPCKWCEREAR